MTFPQLPADKANHFVYGSLAALAGAVVAARFGGSPAFAAACWALCVGVLKEIWDGCTGYGEPDPLDAIATALGGVPVALAVWAA